MTTKLIKTLAMMLLINSTSLAQQSAAKSSGYAPVNGQKIYYEIYGEGKPIILLHGAFMTINMNWGELIPELSKTRKVIALEMQGHGHTAWTSRPISYDALADDVDKTMSFLKIDSADVVGYSFGGTIAYNVVIKYPQRVNKLVIISSTYKFQGWQKEAREALSTLKPEYLTNTPLQTEYNKVAPAPADWNKFISGMLSYNSVDYNLGENNIKNIKSPVLLIIGDNDGIDKSVLIETYKLLGGATFADMAGMPKSQLAIIPGQGHVSVMMQTSALLPLLTTFLQ